MGKMNCHSLLLFFNTLQSEKCQEHFSGRKKDVVDFLQCEQKSFNEDFKELVALTWYIATRSEQVAVAPGFRCDDDVVLRESGTL